MRDAITVITVIIGALNLGFYAWGTPHDPANLAVGIFCLFSVLWVGQWR